MSLERIESLPALPPRPADSHKGRFGMVLVIAGSRGMAGAAALCGASALRSGAGLVRVAAPAEVQPTVASFEPSYMTYPLPDDGDGLIRFEPSISVLKRLLEPADVVAVGPGLGQSADVRALVHWLIKETDRPAGDRCRCSQHAGRFSGVAFRSDSTGGSDSPSWGVCPAGGNDGGCRAGRPNRPRRGARRPLRERPPGRRAQGGGNRRRGWPPGVREHDPATPGWPPAAQGMC